MWVRRGITRTVLVTKRYAIKVPTLRGGTHRWSLQQKFVWFCRGVLANQSEFDWSGVTGLNPVIWRFGFINVYRRALPVGEEFDAYEGIAPDFCPRGDGKPSNVGIVDGQVVWIDYDMSWNGPRCDSCEKELV